MVIGIIRGIAAFTVILATIVVGFAFAFYILYQAGAGEYSSAGAGGEVRRNKEPSDEVGGCKVGASACTRVQEILSLETSQRFSLLILIIFVLRSSQDVVDEPYGMSRCELASHKTTT